MVCEVIISTLLLRVGKLSMVLSAYSRLNFMATAFSIGYMTISCSSRKIFSPPTARMRGSTTMWICVSASTATMSDMIESTRISFATTDSVRSSTAIDMITHGLTTMNCATQIFRKRYSLRELENDASGDASSQLEYTVGVPQQGKTW